MAGGNLLRVIKLFESLSCLCDQANQYIASITGSSNTMDRSLRATSARIECNGICVQTLCSCTGRNACYTPFHRELSAHSSVVSQSYLLSRHMQAFRPEPIPQGFPNSEPWKGVILTLFDQSGGKVSGYRIDGAFRGHHCKVEAVDVDIKYYWRPCLPAVSRP